MSGYWPRTSYFFWPTTKYFWPQTYEYWADYALYAVSVYRLPLLADGKWIQAIAAPSGKLPASTTVIYVARALAQSTVMSLILHNTHASNTNTAQIHIRRKGDVLNPVFAAEMLPGETVLIGEMATLNPGDTVHGNATNALEVSYDASIVERFMV